MQRNIENLLTWVIHAGTIWYLPSLDCRSRWILYRKWKLVREGEAAMVVSVEGEGEVGFQPCDDIRKHGLD